MKTFNCPVCSQALDKGEKTYTCPSGHSFDKAAKGYVNLLMSQKASAKRHGDDRVMVNARRDFLREGWYEPLRKAVLEKIKQAFPVGGTLLDAGCGECWYTTYFYRELCALGLEPNILGIDISKNALEKADRSAAIERAVASVFNIPVAASSCDAVVNIFAPLCASEYCRVLKSGGVLIRAVPLERHLWELKSAVYDKPYENEPEMYELEGFRSKEKSELKYNMQLRTNADIINLFKMTPYYYKTSQHDFEKLKELENLNVSAEFGIAVYEKI